MSDETTEATPEQQKVIIAHDCAMEILTLPPSERRSVVDAISSLVEPADKYELYNRLLEIVEQALPARRPSVSVPRPEMVRPSMPDAMSVQWLGLTKFMESLSQTQKSELVALLNEEQRTALSTLFGLEFPKAH